MAGEILYRESPSMFKNKPIEFILLCALCLIGIGFLIFLVWWLQCKGQVLTITSDKVSMRTGILSKNTNDVYIEDIKNVQIKQSLFNRLFGVGSLEVATAGTSGVEIVISGIANPNEAKSIIEAQRRKAKA